MPADFTPHRVPYLKHRPDTFRIREWAAANGHPVSERGRLARHLIEAFFAAHPELYEQAEKVELVHATARTPSPSPEDYGWVEGSSLRDVYTVAFVRGLDEHEVLRRIGAVDADIRMITDDDYSQPEGPEIVTVRRVGDWTVVVEDCGWRASHLKGLCPLSRDGGEAVAVMRHDYAARHSLAYALDGAYVTDINPNFPLERHGTDPDRLNRHLRELGIDPAADDHLDNPIPAAFAVAGRVTGVVLRPEHLRRPVLGAAVPGAY
ncbi:histone-like nucleoid-structuring protein Lsr2 [Nonomuraea sp. NPDC049421]|uniref:DUF6461 domain-containing protein n=1 Tax=Nonomuraea sp. NPDC049421 TaxID=3155275 RepID=UPI003423316A